MEFIVFESQDAEPAVGVLVDDGVIGLAKIVGGERTFTAAPTYSHELK